MRSPVPAEARKLGGTSSGIVGGGTASSSRDSGLIPWRREAPLSSCDSLVSNGVGPGHIRPTKSGRDDTPPREATRFVSNSRALAATSSAPAENPSAPILDASSCHSSACERTTRIACCTSYTASVVMLSARRTRAESISAEYMSRQCTTLERAERLRPRLRFDGCAHALRSDVTCARSVSTAGTMAGTTVVAEGTRWAQSMRAHSRRIAAGGER
jgi:hypothetical protein